MSVQRLAFLGTPDFALSCLEMLVADGYKIACVYSQPPRPAGRGHATKPSPVHAYAESEGLPVRTPETLRSPAAIADFQSLDLDLAVVVAYGLLLPQAILDAPRRGCLNVHASLLPRWRGAAPIHRAILAGDRETGITLMQMEAGLDSGPILVQETLAIGPDTTAGELHDRLAALGAETLRDSLPSVLDGRIAPRAQPVDGITYAKKLERQEARIDWRTDAETLERQVRAFNPWPGAWFAFGGERIKVLVAEVVPGVPAVSPGRVLDGSLIVACGRGSALRLLKLQRAGRKALAAEEFLKGFSILPGSQAE